MNSQSIDLYRAVRKAHESVYSALQGLRLTMATMPLTDQVDLAYALRESLALIKDMSTQTDQVFDIIQKIAAYQHISSCPQSMTIETEYCAAEATAETFQAVPRACSSQHPEERAEYEALMRYLQIDPQLWDYGEQLYHEGLFPSKVVEIHWPGFQAYCQRLVANGCPIPDGINPNRAYTKFKLKMRKRKDVLSTSSAAPTT